MRNMSYMKEISFVAGSFFMSFVFLLSKSLPHNLVNHVNPVQKLSLPSFMFLLS